MKSTASTPVVQVEALAEVLEDSENEVAEVEDPSTDNSKPIQTGVANGVNDVVVGGVNEVASGDGSEQDEPDANDSEESSSSEEPANDPATEAEAPATPVEDASDEGTSTTEEVAASPMAMAAICCSASKRLTPLRLGLIVQLLIPLMSPHRPTAR